MATLVAADPAPLVRRAALQVLASLSPPRWEAMLAALSDPVWRVRIQAIRQLSAAGAGSPELQAAMLARVSDAGSARVAGARAALAEAWGSASGPVPPARPWGEAARGLPCWDDDPAVLLANLRRADLAAHRALLPALLCLDDSRLVHDLYQEIRAAVIEALLEHGDLASDTALMLTLEDPRHPFLLAWVARFLDRLPEPRRVALSAHLRALPGAPELARRWAHGEPLPERGDAYFRLTPGPSPGLGRGERLPLVDGLVSRECSPLLGGLGRGERLPLVGSLVSRECSPLVGGLVSGERLPLLGGLVSGERLPLLGSLVSGERLPLVGSLVSGERLPFADDLASSRAERSPRENRPPLPSASPLPRPGEGPGVRPLAVSGRYELSARGYAEALEAGVNLWFWEPPYATMGEFLGALPAAQREQQTVVAGSFEVNPRGLRRDLEQALRLLRLPRLPIFLLFWARSAGRLRDDTLAELERMRAAGKIGAWGVSTHDRAVGREALERGAQALMIRYSAAHRGAEGALLPAALTHGVPVLAFSCLCYGKLLEPTPAGPPPTAPELYRFVLAHAAVRACISAPRSDAELRENLTVLSAPALDPARLDWLRQHGAEVYRRSRRFADLVRSR